MSEPIMCLVAAGTPPERETQKQFADAGYNYVTYEQMEPCGPWEKTIAEWHGLGVKVIARWPARDKLGLNEPEFGFRTYDGCSNAVEDGRRAGPSHWHPGVLDIAAPTMRPLYDMGVDGVLVHGIDCDRPFPTDWYGQMPWQHEYAKLFWSFDQHAQADWAAYSDGQQMPTKPPEIGAPRTEELMVFYRWYQGSWLRRIIEYTQVAQEAGFNEVWTFFTPLVNWLPECMANGTAGAVEWLDSLWYGPAKGRGLNPCVVSPVCFNLWPEYVRAGIDAMRFATQVLGWRAISGPHVNAGHDVATRNLRENTELLSGFGFQGCWTAQSFLEGKEDLVESGQIARANFQRGVENSWWDSRMEFIPEGGEGDESGNV